MGFTLYFMKNHIISLLIIFAVQAKGQGFDKALSQLPALPESGAISITSTEWVEKNTVVFTFIKPDSINVSEIRLMNKNIQFLFKANWMDTKDCQHGVQNIALMRDTLDLDVETRLVFIYQNKPPIVYRLVQRLPYNKNICDFYGLVQ